MLSHTGIESIGFSGACVVVAQERSSSRTPMSQLLMSGLIWAFSFWLVADVLRRQSNPLWVVLILLVQPYGGLAYLVYQKWRAYRRVRSAVPAARVAPSLVLAEEQTERVGDDGDGAPPTARSDDAQALLDVADGLEEQRRFDEAASLYRRALELQPADPRSLHGLARCLIELAQTREAIEVYETLMATEPRYRNYAAALEYAEALHRAGRDLDAADLLEGMVAETGRPNHRLALAHYCEAAGQTTRAQRVLSEALVAYASSPARDQAMNRRWQRRISDKLQELAPLGE